MNETIRTLIDKLESTHSLLKEEYAALLAGRDEESAAYLAEKAVCVRKSIYGNRIFIRGLIEVSNICKNNCFYCGIRAGNANCDRYRLTKEQILSCAEEGYALGFRTYVLQGGEDGAFTDDFCEDVIRSLKEKHPDCAITLSLGERSYESYKRLYEAGADRYLLRHETADKAHYEKLHPAQMSYENRMQCLKDLKEIGYAVGCGFMVGSPYQTVDNLASDLKFIEEFQPHMVGIGPFIHHDDTPFAKEPDGTLEMTVYLLSILRLMLPHVLLPATTALGTIDPMGREKGILCGANVVMPNLSPADVRSKYTLYANKLNSGSESAQLVEELKARMEKIGYAVVVDRGDPA